ncbi:MAG: phosphoglycerate dehydrogenase [Candidatus Omnitrophota bacterium]|nr:phosphoglycerate dehydrogenase [Candidatus Omnitrophota bacterium]
MIKILVSDPLSEEGLKILKAEKELQVDVKPELKPEALKEIIKDYDALIVRSATKVTKDIISAADKLKVIGRAGVGLDNVDLAAATAKGIIVMNTPGGNTISTCEHTLSMLLALSRNIPQADSSTKSGEWKRSKFMGVEVYGKTLGIVGLGRIGTEVAKRALSFGMKIVACDPFLSRSKAEQLSIELMELKDLFKKADYITVHTPLTDETRHMISNKEFAMMKDGVRIINCARGGIVDETALLKALEAKKVAGAALDVFENEPPKDSALVKLSNVVVTPHLGASTEEAQVNVAVEIAEAVRDALLGGGIRNAANYPCLEPEVCKLLKPYINLSEKLGLFVGQLIEGRLSDITVEYSGEISKLDCVPLTIALVKGLLAPILQDTVNFVNALSLAKERGVKLNETKSEQSEEFTNLISVEVKTDKDIHRLSGTLFTNKELRIVKLDDFYLEATPQGVMLLIHNLDKPGVIGSLGTFLGKQHINIAAMTFGREVRGGKAISVLNIDSAPSPDVLNQIKKIENISAVKMIKL